MDVTLPDGERLGMKLTLDPADYRTAAHAHVDNALVTVSGVLHRAKRGAAELREHRSFRRVA